MPNRYILCSRTRAALEFDISNERPADDAEITYFIRAFQILEREYGLDGYTVCFAWGSNTRLPRVGPDVIAVIYGDEHCRIPAYADAVAAVFKCHGFFPTFVPRRRPLRLAQIELAEFLRDLALWLPSGWRYAFSGRMPARCYLVPVGYGLPTDVEPLPFEQRPHIASFLGSIAAPPRDRPLRTLIGTPKSYCRRMLVQVLRRLQDHYGTNAIQLGLTGGFQDSLQDAGQVYFHRMARTQLCMAPRGTAHETLRVAEGLRFGCVVIADRLPPHPFYENSPIIQIKDWRELLSVVTDLLADENRLRDLHERSLRHWRDVLSEQALAKRCAEALGLVRSAA